MFSMPWFQTLITAMIEDRFFQPLPGSQEARRDQPHRWVLHALVSGQRALETDPVTMAPTPSLRRPSTRGWNPASPSNHGGEP